MLHAGHDTTPKTHFYVYVDNLGVISPGKTVVTEAMLSLQERFGSLRLELHGSEMSEEYAEALGCVLHGSDMCARVNPKRLWRVHHALKGLLGRNRCIGKALEIIIGHCTFLGCSIAVAWLSFTVSINSFAAVTWLQFNYLRSELKALMGICFLMTQDWWRQNLSG